MAPGWGYVGLVRMQLHTTMGVSGGIHQASPGIPQVQHTTEGPSIGVGAYLSVSDKKLMAFLGSR